MGERKFMQRMADYAQEAADGDTGPISTQVGPDALADEAAKHLDAAMTILHNLNSYALGEVPKGVSTCLQHVMAADYMLSLMRRKNE